MRTRHDTPRGPPDDARNAYLKDLAADVLRACLVAAVGVLIREVVALIEGSRDSHPANYENYRDY